MRFPQLSLGIPIALLTSLTPLSFNVVAAPLTVPQVLAQTPNARQTEADQLLQQGIEQLQTSQFEAALQSWQQALTLYQEINDRAREGTVLGNLGLVYNRLRNYTKAIEYLQQSLAIARKLNNRSGEEAVLGNLGNTYALLGDYTKAIEYLQQSLALARELKHLQNEGNALGNLANAYDFLGDYAKSIEYTQQWLAIARQINNPQSEGKALGNLGVTYHALGDYAKAIEYQQQSLAIAREIKDRQLEGNTLGSLALAYSRLGDYAKAIEYLQQNLVIVREIKDRQSEGKTLGNLGNDYASLGDYAKAIDYHQQSLAIAREIRNRQGEGAALGNLGLAYSSLGDYAKGIEYAQQQLMIARETKNLLEEGISLNNLGLYRYKSGNLAGAETNLMNSITVLESLRAGLNDANKVSIFEEQANTYRTLQQVLIQENKTDAALEIAERGRARAFVELLARRLSTNPTEQPNITPPTIEQIKQTAKAQNATLVEYSIIYDKFKINGKQESHESELYIWVIKPTGEVSFRRSDLKPLWQQQNISLAELVTTSRDAIGVRGRGLEVVARVDGASQTHHLQQLYQRLIQPIADLLPTDPTARVIFIPQKELFLVPFPALQDASGQYLIQKHTILTAPAIAVLDLTHQRRQHVPGSARDVLVVGNPTMPLIQPPGQKPSQLASLAGAEQEAKTIATLFNTQALIKYQATKASIVSRLPQAKIIHLATHGLLDDFQGGGVPGAIALAPSKPGVPNDGLLTSNEILDLKLNAELVVLSACDTGRGKVTGDGVIGLSRSLITAGVPSIIVSLWSIPDAPTAQLMSEFYQNLNKNPDKAIALRQAMLKTMEQYPQPQNWAAFTLIGESN